MPNESPTINWGIIGCGDVTEVKSGPAFNKVPKSKLVAVMRRNAAKAEDYARRHQVPKWYSDVQQLIDDPDVNAIYIATPPSSHKEYTVRALRSGKPVYLEKPVTLNAAEAEEIRQVVNETGVRLSVAHYRRQQPLFLKVRWLLEQGAIGPVRMIDLCCFQPHKSAMIAQTEVPWRLDPVVSGGGLFHDLAPHQLDLMLYYFGKVKHAAGISTNTAGYYEAPDTVSGQIVFENGALFNGLWCFAVPKSERLDRCHVIGSEGRISFPVFEHQQLVLNVQGKEEIIPFNQLEHVQQPMIQQVVSYFLNEAENPCSIDEGLEVMQIIDAFSMHSSQLIR